MFLPSSSAWTASDPASTHFCHAWPNTSHGAARHRYRTRIAPTFTQSDGRGDGVGPLYHVTLFRCLIVFIAQRPGFFVSDVLISGSWITRYRPHSIFPKWLSDGKNHGVGRPTPKRGRTVSCIQSSKDCGNAFFFSTGQKKFPVGL